MFGTARMQRIAHSRRLGTIDFHLTGWWSADLERPTEVRGQHDAHRGAELGSDKWQGIY